MGVVGEWVESWGMYMDMLESDSLVCANDIVVGRGEKREAAMNDKLGTYRLVTVLSMRVETR
jgi:hypothetical protein